jgi:putative endonuclease
LVYQNEFQNPNDAIAFEKQIKKWSRAKKEALIAGDIDKLKELSKSKNNYSEK